MNNQEEFLARIRAALGKQKPAANREAPRDSPTDSSPADSYRLSRQVSAAVRERMLADLKREARALHIQLTICPNEAAAGRAVSGLINEKSGTSDSREVVLWDHPLLNRLKLSEQSHRGIIFHRPDGRSEPLQRTKRHGTERRAAIEPLAASFMGITSADYCLAATASLVIRSRPGQDQLVALLPAIHVAVIKSEQLLFNLEHLYQILGGAAQATDPENNGCLSLISGPSKTGDIEATMVNGVHGPREVYLFIINQA